MMLSIVRKAVLAVDMDEQEMKWRRHDPRRCSPTPGLDARKFRRVEVRAAGCSVSSGCDMARN